MLYTLRAFARNPNDRFVCFLRNFSCQFYLRSELLLEICEEEVAHLNIFHRLAPGEVVVAAP